MSSSTSSSDQGPDAGKGRSASPDDACRGAFSPSGNAWRIAATVVLSLVALDIGVREVLLPQSRDFINIQDFPRRASALSQVPGRKLTVFGNSAVLCGVDPQLLTQSLHDRHVRDIPADIFPADDSRMVDWYCMVNRYFWEAGNSVDILVVCFFDRQLADSRSTQVGRLARWFATPSDWPALFEYCLKTSGDRVDFVVSSAWTSFAVRSRLRERMLKLCVPDCEAFAKALNATELDRQQERSPGPRAAQPSYHLLSGFLARAEAHHTRLIFVAFPRRPDATMPEDTIIYPLDDEALALIRNAGMDFIDLRQTEGLSADKYLDFIHLTPEGKVIFTHTLADRLAILVGRNK
jgi:hypothetical protein